MKSYAQRADESSSAYKANKLRHKPTRIVGLKTRYFRNMALAREMGRRTFKMRPV